jgi:putative FmdB family regulatory protein
MPLYEYQCQKCGKVIEALQKFSDDPLTKCEECGGRLEKLISKSSFALKGKGWYKTDYQNKPKGTKKAPS